MAKRDRTDGYNCVMWQDLTNHLTDYYTKLFKEERAKRVIPKRYEYFHPSKYSAGVNTGGDQRLRDLRKALHYLDEYPDKWRRSKQQKQFHEAFIAACIRNVYKNEFASNYMRILKENNWDEARQEVLICCPRRFGKTIAVCWFVAAFALTQPNCKICIFSPGRRQSEMLLEQVKEFVFKYPFFKVKKLNKENLWLHGKNDNDTRKIMAYPSKVEINAT